jgi:hypothetical protein
MTMPKSLGRNPAITPQLIDEFLDAYGWMGRKAAKPRERLCWRIIQWLQEDNARLRLENAVLRQEQQARQSGFAEREYERRRG